MAITIPTAASIGAFSEDVAADAAEQGNYGPRIANALLVLAAEATADIAAVEGGGGGTAAMPGHDSFMGLWASGTTIVTFTTGTASTAITTGGHGAGYVIPSVVFPAGAWTGTVTLVGYDRNGSEQSVVYANPGAGGGTVVGTKAFSLLTTAVAASPSGSATVTVKSSNRLALSHAPVTAIHKVVASGGDITGDITGSSLTEGWVEFGGYDGASTYDIVYAWTLTVA